jgi:hypothetical protein
MRTTIPRIVVAAVAAALTTGLTRPSAGADAPVTLDGKTFVGETAEKGKSAQSSPEEIVFKDGTFRSKACDAYGFTEAAYTVKTRYGAAIFSAETHSPNEGTIRWKGKVEGDKLEGTYIWTKEGQPPMEGTVKATLKP